MAKRLLIRNQTDLIPELTLEIPENGIITVGSEPFSSIPLNGENIAPEQFVIVCEESQMTLLCRVAGTLVNGENLSQGALHILQVGDLVGVSEYTITVSNGESIDETTTEPDVFQELKAKTSAVDPMQIPLIKSQESLNDVLEGLRSEEKFYFSVIRPGKTVKKIFVEREEMILGWDEDGNCLLSIDPDKFAVTHAQIRKDWTGVVIYPLRKGSVWLNSEAISEIQRLKNGDQLNLALKEGIKPSFETEIHFHEPTALMALDSILSKELPPPIVLSDFDKSGIPNKDLAFDDTDNEISRSPAAEIAPFKKRRIFGYFTMWELLVMAIGTIITAFLIFLILEYY